MPRILLPQYHRTTFLVTSSRTRDSTEPADALSFAPSLQKDAILLTRYFSGWYSRHYKATIFWHPESYFSHLSKFAIGSDDEQAERKKLPLDGTLAVQNENEIADRDRDDWSFGKSASGNDDGGSDGSDGDNMGHTNGVCENETAGWAITQIRSYFDADECAKMIDRAEKAGKWQHSTWSLPPWCTDDELYYRNHECYTRTRDRDPRRQSQQTSHDVVSHGRFLTRLADLFGSWVFECSGIIRYQPGDYIHLHTDGGLKSAIIYLNDLNEGDGGETCFPNFDHLCFKPTAGTVLWWENVPENNNSSCYPLESPVRHSGEPVRGTAPKYVISCQTAQE
jgi:hypothetical protein